MSGLSPGRRLGAIQPLVSAAWGRLAIPLTLHRRGSMQTADAHVRLAGCARCFRRGDDPMNPTDRLLTVARKTIGRSTAGVFDGLSGSELTGWVRDPAGGAVMRFGAETLSTRANRPRPDLNAAGVSGQGFAFMLEEVAQMLDSVEYVGDLEAHELIVADGGGNMLANSSGPVTAPDLRAMLAISVAVNVLGARVKC